MVEEKKFPSMIDNIMKKKFDDNTELVEEWDKFAEYVKPLIEHDEKIFEEFKTINTHIHLMGMSDVILGVAVSAERIALTKLFNFNKNLRDKNGQ